jgi:tubulin polyglutamylase TTLL6/13
MRMQTYQKINHFPGMNQLTRKASLARSIGRLRAYFPQVYAFFPRTWTLPAELSDFRNYIAKSGGKKTFIVKPDASCQGKGIYLTRTSENVDPQEPQIAQRYLCRPLLLGRYKFDLRVYALVLSCDPLRVLMYNDGLVRICTEKYAEPTKKNMANTCIPLTN